MNFFLIFVAGSFGWGVVRGFGDFFFGCQFLAWLLLFVASATYFFLFRRQFPGAWMCVEGSETSDGHTASAVVRIGICHVRIEF